MSKSIYQYSGEATRGMGNKNHFRGLASQELDMAGNCSK